MTALYYIGLVLLILMAAAAQLLLYSAGNYVPRVPPPVSGTVRIACVGDSITFGALVKRRGANCYPAQLQKLLGSRYSVRNFGANGHAAQKSADKPYWQHPYFKASTEFDSDIVLLMLGTNDALERNWRGAGPFIADYREMITHYQALPKRPVVCLMTPPTQFPVDNPTKVIHELRKDELSEITEAIIKLGAELSLSVIDVNTATKNHPEYFKFDGIHPDAGGARLIAETACRVLTTEVLKG